MTSLLVCCWNEKILYLWKYRKLKMCKCAWDHVKEQQVGARQCPVVASFQAVEPHVVDSFLEVAPRVVRAWRRIEWLWFQKCKYRGQICNQICGVSISALHVLNLICCSLSQKDRLLQTHDKHI